MANKSNSSQLQFFRGSKVATALSAGKFEDREFTTKDGEHGSINELVFWFGDSKYNYKVTVTDSNQEGVDRWAKIARFTKKSNAQRYA